MDVKPRSHGRGEIERRWSRSLLDRRGAISALLRSTRSVQSTRSVWSARCCDRWDRWSVGCRTGARSEDWALSYSSISLSLSLCAWVRKWFEVKIFTLNHFRVKAIKTHGQLKIFFGKFIFHAQPNTCIYGKAFPEVIWSQKKHSLISYRKRKLVIIE